MAYGSTGAYPTAGGTNRFGGPSNSLWVGNNYSQSLSMPSNPGLSQTMYQDSMMPIAGFNNILQVMGLESAEEFKIGPNSKVILMDSNKPVFYLKESDDSGYSEVKTYRFEEVTSEDKTDEKESEETAEYVTSKEFSNFKKKINNGKYVTKKDFEEFKTFIEDLVMKNE